MGLAPLQIAVCGGNLRSGSSTFWGLMFMFTKFWQFSVILSVVAIYGCMDSSNDAGWLDPRPLGQDFSTFRPPKKPLKTVSDIPEITEPNGAIALREALALALMHNPELRAFSWEVRASEARTLQASLLPNPEIEVEVEICRDRRQVCGHYKELFQFQEISAKE